MLLLLILRNKNLWNLPVLQGLNVHSKFCKHCLSVTNLELIDICKHTHIQTHIGSTFFSKTYLFFLSRTKDELNSRNTISIRIRFSGIRLCPNW